MPFIVTTKRRCAGRDPENPCDCNPIDGFQCRSSRTVATLDEARTEIAARAYSLSEQTRREAREAITESGGTVTLPDGTVIEVKPVRERCCGIRVEPESEQ